eukprot:7258974-Karenia_brevis.AAC.1
MGRKVPHGPPGAMGHAWASGRHWPQSAAWAPGPRAYGPPGPVAHGPPGPMGRKAPHLALLQGALIL